ncbi:MAG: hypothetical protein J7L77_06705 [Clostridiales bacterium]|nr:hypothetical protein [Clostridiales bacterium]
MELLLVLLAVAVMNYTLHSCLSSVLEVLELTNKQLEEQYKLLEEQAELLDDISEQLRRK